VLGGVVGGVGWGSSYSGSLRTLSPLAEPDQRAGLFAGVFTVAYLAFGVPVVIAGQQIPRAGLSSTAIGYCVATGVAAITGLIAQSAVARRRAPPDAAETRQGRDFRDRLARLSTTQHELRRDPPPVRKRDVD
jgi:hypothetical protein